MTQEAIKKAFEGRWRIKGNTPTGWVKGVRELCFDFFEAGILIAEGSVCCDTIATAPSVQTTDQSFDEWWQLYNKKRGKEKCMKKWAKLSAKDKSLCIAATPAYVASTPDPTYRKDPITYLNNKSWNDEIYFRNNGNTTDNDPYLKLAAVLAP